MSSTMRGWASMALLGALMAAGQVVPAPAVAAPQNPSAPADPAVHPPADQQNPTPPATGELRNVTYRARIDGVARGASIAYQAENGQTITADPTMLPGRTFEASTVLPVTANASMEVSIDWPYSANLHCEILVDGQLASASDNFVAPRLLRPQDDPSYGTLTCQAPVATPPPPPSAA